MDILSVKDLSISFDGHKVFSDIDLQFKDDEIHGIIGTNGAGKTTLFNIICGIVKPTGGQVFFYGEDITSLPSWQRSRMGISRCFQNVIPFNSLTPYENAKVARSTAGRFNKENETFSLDEIMELTNLEKVKNKYTADLSLPNKKNTEIARALATNPKIILFDEVSTGLSGEEIIQRMELMRTIAKHGITVVVIEHVMLFIKEICDIVSVVHAGSIISQGDPITVSNDPKVIDAYLGGSQHACS